MEKYTCSICGGNLLPGRAAVRKSIVAKLQWPFPSDRLIYKGNGEGQKPVTILREGVSNIGYRCDECGVVLITMARYVP